MRILRSAVSLWVALALLAGLAMASSAPGASPGARAGASKKHRKRCPKGYRLKTVRKHGKKVKRCRKIKGTGGGGGGNTGANAPLFEPPGHKLEGEETRPFLQKYLVNSTFTDCPAAWPNCAVEERYSHTGESFFYCRLTSSSGSDIINGARAFRLMNAVVEADGSWTFNEEVDNYGNPSYYEWHVTTAGVVTGVYQYNETQQLGPLQYVAGARDCSY